MFYRYDNKGGLMVRSKNGHYIRYEDALESLPLVNQFSRVLNDIAMSLLDVQRDRPLYKQYEDQKLQLQIEVLEKNWFLMSDHGHSTYQVKIKYQDR